MSDPCTSQGRPGAIARVHIRGVVVVLACVLSGIATFRQPSRGAEKPAKSLSKSTPAANDSLDDGAEAADDNALDQDLTGLVVPAQFLAKAKEIDKLQFSQALRGALLEGLSDHADSLEAAKKHVESAHRFVPDDPRAPYAYGMILLARNKPRVALEQFHLAATRTKAPYLPALQGAAWVLVERGDYAEGFTALLDLTRCLKESRDNWPTAHDKERSAEWLGGMIGYLAGPGRVPEHAARIDKLVADVGKSLAAEHQQAYARGRKAVAGRFEEQKALAARPADEVLSEAGRKREEFLAAAAAAESEAKKLEGDLVELKKPYDTQLADLSREIRTNGTKVKSLAPRLEEAKAEVEELSVPKKHPQMKSGYRRVPTVVARNENAGEKKIRESQLASARQKLQKLESEGDDAKKRIADAKTQRDTATAEYRRASGARRPLLLAAQKKSADLAASARSAELTPEKLKLRVRALETYVPFYFEVEKGRLLATLKSPS